MTVLIVGGGIGGLAAAVALRRAGINARVFERAREIREVGAGVTIWSNAIMALQSLGLGKQVRSLGSEMLRINVLSAKGKLISSIDVEAISRACGAPSLALHRADLQRILLEALDTDQVHTAKECVGVTQDQNGVTLRFADGTEAAGEIAIGADGVRSVVRSSLFGSQKLRSARYYCYRGMAATPRVTKHEVLSVLLPGIQLGVFPEVRPGEAYWFLCRNKPFDATLADVEYDHMAFLRSVSREFPAELGAMIVGTDPERILVDEVLDRPPDKHWGHGRVSLIGDAAHPMAPTFGPGACMAIEDAVILADSLRRAMDPGSGLRDYENRRRRRTAAITRLSWYYGNTFQWEQRVLVMFRTLPAASPFGPWKLRRILRKALRFRLPDLAWQANK
ncbi:MAG: FAD-dependent monooxygenase [Gammaproteobacteria bacterium]|nr:FAD-dependent monooxygenase [Gammaproteobacteria bacterium]